MAGAERPNIEEQLKDNVVSTKEANDLRDFLQSKAERKDKKVLMENIKDKKGDILSGLDRTFNQYTKDSLDKTIDDTKNADGVIAYEKIITYFKNGFSKEGNFGDLNGIQKDMLKNIEQHILEYKTNVIKKNLDKTLSTTLEAYTNLDESVITEIKNALGKEQDKGITKFGKEYGINGLYNIVAIRKGTPNIEGYKEKVDEILAAVNRASLLSGFGDLIQGNEELKTDTETNKIHAVFETMLGNTSDKVINKMTRELMANGHDDLAFISMFKNIKRILKNKDIKPNNFADFRVLADGAAKRIGEMTQRIEEPTTIRSIDFMQIKTQLETILNNPNIKEISIKAPSDQADVINWTFKDFPGKDKIKVERIDNLKKVSINATEIKESTGKISLSLPKLDANVTVSKQDIENLLSQNPEMKALIMDPNYKIIGGKIAGSASLNTNIGYKGNPDFNGFKNSPNISIQKESTSSTNSNVIGNEKLAFDRASSFLNYFYGMDGKVASNAKFALNYKVDGPTKEDLKKANPNASEADLSEIFKQRQNANLDLDFIKTETKQQDIGFNVNEITHTKDYAFMINAGQTLTSSIKEGISNIGSGIGSALTSLIPNFSGSGHIKFKGCGCSKH